MRERGFDRRGERGGRAPIIGRAERADTVARIAQILASAQDRVPHLLIGQGSGADQPLAADIGAPLIRRYGDDRIEPPDPRAAVE